MGYLDDIKFAKKLEKKIEQDQRKLDADERKEEMQIYRTMDKLNKYRTEHGQKEPYLTDYYLPVKSKRGVQTCRVTNVGGVGLSAQTLKVLSDLQRKLNDGICTYRRKRKLKVQYTQI